MCLSLANQMLPSGTLNLERMVQNLFCWWEKCSEFNGTGSGGDLGSGSLPWKGPAIVAALLESGCFCSMTLTVFLFYCLPLFLPIF